MHVKKGDTVLILSGDDKGKTGVITEAFPREGKILIDGINTVKKHERPRKQGQKGQVVDRPMPFYASKVAKTDAVKKTKKAK
ncbi:MAG: 50S ribosomal protein L24 [Patescibacteria group bacterium]